MICRNWVLSLLLLLLVAVEAAPPDDAFNPTDKADARKLAKQLAAMTEDDTQALWGQYRSQYAKTYVSEEPTRYGHFKASIQRVIKVNSDDNATYWAALNFFSDMSFQEFKDTMLMPESALTTPNHQRKLASEGRKLLGKPTKPPPPPAPTYTYPNTWDWRTQGKVFPIQSQGNCGSCWAFAATSVVESWALIKNKLTSNDSSNKLSEQQLNDCVYSGASGCGGGNPATALAYVYRNFQTLTSTYGSYLSGSSGTAYTCNTAALATATTKIKTNSPGYKQLAANNANEFFQNLYAMPIDIGFSVTQSFQDYKSGIYSDTSCDNVQMNHNMAAIGYDLTAGLGNAGSYILLKNSWNTWWGESGYARVKAYADKTVGSCRIYTYNFIPI